MKVTEFENKINSQKYLADYNRNELKEFFVAKNEAEYRADQIFKDVYLRKVSEFDEIKTLPIKIRTLLNNEFSFSSIKIENIRKSADGSIKFLYKLKDGNFVESVFMPWYESDTETLERATLCISSMAGCPVKCTFCATGTLGKIRNLETSEIIEQVLIVEKYLNTKLTNIVFMGMGEPLLNYRKVARAISIFTDDSTQWFSRRRITLSTVGIPTKIKELSNHQTPVKLALSLHATTQGTRNKIIPILKNIKLSDILSAVEYYYRKTKMPVTYEYIPFAGINDTKEDAKRLAKISKRVPSRINLIPFNDISFTNPKGFAAHLKATTKDEISRFVKEIRQYGGIVTLRDTFGSDIEAACGQLALTQ